MPRPKITPRYVIVEMQVVMDPQIPPAAKETYMRLKALAYGAREVTFTCDEFNELFGVPRSTLYRHLSLLANAAVLRFGMPGSRITGLVYVRFLAGAYTRVRSLNNGTSLINPPPHLSNIDVFKEEEVEGGVWGGNPKNETVPKMRLDPTAGLLAGDPCESPQAQEGRRVDPGEICIRILWGVTGFVTYPSSADAALCEQILWTYYLEHGSDVAAAIETLRPFYQTWHLPESEGGQGYRKTNMGWLTDWAATRTIPESKTPGRLGALRRSPDPIDTSVWEDFNDNDS